MEAITLCLLLNKLNLFSLTQYGVILIQIVPLHLRLSYLQACQYKIVLYCGRVPAANAPGCTAAEGLLYKL